MQTLQAHYFAAYRSLRLTRDANGVLVADLVKSMQAKSESVAQKGRVA